MDIDGGDATFSMVLCRPFYGHTTTEICSCFPLTGPAYIAVDGSYSFEALRVLEENGNRYSLRRR